MNANPFAYFMFRFGFLIVLVVFSSLAWADTTNRVSVSSDEQQANGYSFHPSISADGRYIVFYTDAPNLVENDTNTRNDIFLRDRATGETSRVSVNSSQVQGNNDSAVPSISPNGSHVVFFSAADNLVENDNNNHYDIFIHNLVAGATTLVSVNSNEEQANGASFSAVVSYDGRYIAFNSYATNLVNDDLNNARDVFVRDRMQGSTTRINVASDGTQANRASSLGAFSHTGNYIVFSSSATNLVNADTNNKSDIFVHNRALGSTRRVSVDSYGNQANGASRASRISSDGRYVVYESVATNLIENDGNGKRDIFRSDLVTGETTCVSVNSNGGQANEHSYTPAISGNGRYVVFTSYATNLVEDDTNNKGDVFVHDLHTGETTRVSINSAGDQANNYSSDIYSPEISADGRHVVFHSTATNLVDADTNNKDDIFVFSRNSPPVLSMTQTPDNSISINGYALLNAAPDDPDSDPILHRWSVTEKTPGSVYHLFYDDHYFSLFSPRTKGEFRVRYQAKEQVPFPDMEQSPVLGWLWIKGGENSKPIVNAGQDQTIINNSSSGVKAIPGGILPGMSTTLHGSANDPDNDPLDIEWTVVSKPSGASAGISKPQQLDTNVWLTKDGSYVFKLTATENLPSGPEYKSSDTITVLVLSQ